MPPVPLAAREPGVVAGFWGTFEGVFELDLEFLDFLEGGGWELESELSSSSEDRSSED